jgi:hypothetical protein
LAARASAGPGKLTPSHTFCWKYSDAVFGRMCSGLKRSSPIAPDFFTRLSTSSIWARNGGIHEHPCSVITNFNLGNRSKTPDRSMKISGRREYPPSSVIWISAELGCGRYVGPPTPPWQFSGTPRSSATAHSRS